MADLLASGYPLKQTHSCCACCLLLPGKLEQFSLASDHHLRSPLLHVTLSKALNKIELIFYYSPFEHVLLTNVQIARYTLTRSGFVLVIGSVA